MIPVDSKLPETTIETEKQDESRSFRIVRIIVGIALGAQAGLLSLFAGFCLIFILLLGGMATIVSGGQATEENFVKAWLIMFAMILTPFVVTIFVAMSAASVLLRKGRMVVIIACLMMIAFPFAIPYVTEEPLELGNLTATIVIINSAGIIVALMMKPKRKL